MAINLDISDNRERIPLSVQSNTRLRSVNTDNGSPYYVGARAYVTQTDNGAVVTVIDKDGTTTATILNGVDGANGVGIISITQNANGTLTINLDDGTSYVTEPLKGETGNGIASVMMNADYTLTILFTDGTSITTDSIRGEKGEKGDDADIDSITNAELEEMLV